MSKSAALLSTLSRALLWLALYAGRAPEFFARTHVAKGETLATTPVVPTYDRAAGLLWVPAGDHLPYRVLDEEQKLAARPLQQTLGLPLPPPVIEALDVYLSGRNMETSDGSILFTADETKRAVWEINRFLSGVNEARGTRLTLTRITRCLHEQLLQVPGGGHVEAALITGHIPPYSRNPMFYTHVTESRLRALYRQACAQIAVKASCDPFFTTVDETTSGSESGVGSGIVPTRETVRDSVQWLLEGLWCARGAPLEARAMLIHNHIVAYALTMLHFGTGHRDTINPFSRIDEIDLARRIVVASDKDWDDYFGSHAVRLPQICCDQFQAYLNHLEGLADYLSIIAPGLAGQIRQLHHVRHAKPRRVHQQQKEENLSLFFWLQRKTAGTRRKGPGQSTTGIAEPYVALPVTPSTLASFWGPLSALPENSNRHYLRTELRASGCPDEAIDPNNGHWCHGGEPGGRHSCHSPRTCNDILDQYLSAILQTDGWQVEEGWNAN